MLTRQAIILLALISLTSCAGPVQPHAATELDYTEVEDQTGWQLRVYGNGSGVIAHGQLPAYHLHYPRGTFDVEAPRLKALHCPVTSINEVCTRLTYYSARLDSTFHCTCVPANWTNALMTRAIDQMADAVEAGGSERSCRMLRRQWLSPAGRMAGR